MCACSVASPVITWPATIELRWTPKVTCQHFIARDFRCRRGPDRQSWWTVCIVQPMRSLHGHSRTRSGTGRWSWRPRCASCACPLSRSSRHWRLPRACGDQPQRGQRPRFCWGAIGAVPPPCSPSSCAPNMCCRAQIFSVLCEQIYPGWQALSPHYCDMIRG